MKFSAFKSGTLLLAAATLLSGASAWADQKLVPAQSDISFVSKQMGVPVEGRFKRFDAQMAFDPKKPDTAKIAFNIDPTIDVGMLQSVRLPLGQGVAGYSAARGEPIERPPVWAMRQAGRCLPEYRALKEKHTFVELARTPQLFGSPRHPYTQGLIGSVPGVDQPKAGAPLQPQTLDS